MKKYKVKITCPLFKKGDIFETDDVGLVWVTNLSFEPTFYPDIFEEIKEPLFVTEDGKSIFEGDEFIFLFSTWESDKCPYGIGRAYKDNTPSKFPYFSTKEAAEKWIEENKPMFSRKQVRDAIISTDYTINCGEYWTNTNSLKKELGL